MRIMALDFGARTVGVAVTDPLGLTVQGVETVRREHEDKLRQIFVVCAFEHTDGYQIVFRDHWPCVIVKRPSELMILSLLNASWAMPF